jgi:oligosaccharide repeat unit polymerase
MLLAPYAAMLPLAGFDPQEEIPAEISIFAIAFHISCMIFFALGFQLGGRLRPRNIRPELVRLNWSPVRLGVLFGIAALSVIVAVYSVSAIVDVESYLSDVYLYNNALNLRASSSQLSGVEGGVSGIIKMWGGSAFGVLIGLLSLCLSLRGQPAPKGIVFLICAVVGLVSIRSLIGADRGEIFGVLMLSAAYFILAGKLTVSRLVKVVVLGGLVAAGAVAIFGIISEGRMEGGGAFTYAVLYSKLGLANLSLLMEFEHQYTFGANSVFNAALFIVQYLSGSSDIFGSATYHWVWNPAEDLMGAAYLDFGLFGVILFFGVGCLIGWSLNSALLRGSPWHFVIFFAAAYAFATGVGVPKHRGPEFWVSLIVAFVTVRLLTKRFYRRIAATGGVRRLASPRSAIGEPETSRFQGERSEP